MDVEHLWNRQPTQMNDGDRRARLVSDDHTLRKTPKVRGEIGQQDFKWLRCRDTVERVHNAATLSAHDVYLGLLHNEQGRYTEKMFCEGSEDEWANKTDLRHFIRVFLPLSILSTIGNLLRPRIVRWPGIRT